MPILGLDPLDPAGRGHIMRWLTTRIKKRQARRLRYAAALAEGQRLVDQWKAERGVRA